MRLILAPMEGLTDPNMRQVLTKVGQFDWCVSEFIRITNVLLPDHVYHKYCPELLHDCKTQSGTPLHIQLLGSDAVALAENAHKLAEMGAPAIDLNFGCPAKTVNKHGGGAVLLDETEHIYRIVSQVRQAVPKHVPVSAKMRLGNLSDAPALQNALAIQQAGANWLTIHARTKADGYSPPAYWHKIKPIKQLLYIPIIANGEIWNATHAKECQLQSGCCDLMLGRGAVVRPDLTLTIKGLSPLSWQEVLNIQVAFLQDNCFSEQGLVGRYKQWLGMLSQGFPEAQLLWQQVKRLKNLHEILSIVQNQQYQYSGRT